MKNPQRAYTRIPLEPNLFLMFGVTLMVVMGVASVSPAFPTIMRELGITEQEVGLLISFFTVPGVLFAPVAGVLADRIGRKKILIPALFLFGIAGGACGFVHEFRHLLALRFLQGLGATSMGTLNVTIIGDLYTGRTRTSVLGYNITVLNIGTAMYPAIGGALAMLGWQYPFMLPLVAIPLGVAVLFLLDSPEPDTDQAFISYIGDVVRSLGRRQAAGVFIIGVVSFLVLYGAYMTYLPILLDSRFSASSLAIGGVMFVTSFTTALTSTRAGSLAGRISEKYMIVTGFLCYALSMALIPFMNGLVMFVIPTALLGIGLGTSIPCIQSILVGMAPVRYRAAFLSVNSLMLRLGQTLGPLIMSGIMIVRGIDGVFFTGALLSLVMVIVAVTMIGRR